jgi:precorrin-3B C17-methyltransferase/precorrin-6y C5,15-methyltransferase (decarboxylating) CbiE subunit/precorrin-6Y C5,15-methyltransferase (decarboxylating) CbiT subunit
MSELVHVIGLLGGRPVGDDALAALAEASLVAGGEGQLRAVADLLAPDVETATVAGGLAALEDLARHPGPVAVLASGDPGFHGIVRALGARLGPERLVVHPAPSSVALAFARLGLPWDDAVVASCHTGDAASAAAQVAGAPVAAVLCGPAAPPEAVGAALVTLGAHHPIVAVASRLGEAGDTFTRLGEAGDALTRLDGVAALAAGHFDHRSVVVLAHPPSPVRPSARTGGRPVAAFAHRAGMITKPEVRAVVLGRLDLPERGVLWDVGAGSGSVAIEAALAAPGLRVVAVERDPTAAATIVANAAALGAVVEVIEGTAPAALAGLPRPDRVFVGGGGIDVLDATLAAAAPGVRVVATYAAADRALAARTRLGALTQVSVDRATDLPDGGVRFVADNPVFVAWGDAPAAEPPRPVVAVGIGCSSGATAAEVEAVTAEALATAGETLTDVVATVDRRAGHPAVTPGAVTFPASLLGQVAVPSPSEAVADAVGTPSVAEAAALLAAGPGARLVAPKHKGATATAAVAVAPGPRDPAGGRVAVVGLGPSGAAHRTPAAVAAVRTAGAVIGYGPYIDAAAALLRPDQLVLRSTMGAEIARAGDAVALAAAGWRVAVVSSGDPGVFAMASVTLELAAVPGVPVDVVPGVTSAHAAAAAAGAPLAGPHAALTLSDLLMPWERIEAQLRAAAGAGLALALFNPRSAGRPDHLARAVTVLYEVLDPATPVTLVSDATGPHQDVVVTTLAGVDPTAAGMRTIVLVGTADTTVLGGRVVTRRHHPWPEPAR